MCEGCGKIGHWKRVCRSLGSRKKYSNSRSQHVHELRADVDGRESGGDLYFHPLSIDTNTVYDSGGTQALLKLQLKSCDNTLFTMCKLDTGAEGNVIPASTFWKVTEDTELSASTSRIIAYGGHPIEQLGTYILTVKHLDTEQACTFHVTKTAGPVIISLPTCRALGLVILN